MEMLACLDGNETRCVMDVATETGTTEDVSSKNLQLLELGGFLDKKRNGKYLFYSLNRNDQFLRAVLSAMRNGKLDTAGIMYMLTALTHERRILIVAALAGGHQEFGPLCQRTGIPRPSMERHLDKLVRRGFVSYRNGRCRLLKPPNRLAAELVRLATG